MWNSLELQCPIGDLVSYPPPDHYIMENLRNFVTVLTAAADTLTVESPLWNEMNVLRNIQAKYKRILRCDRVLISLQRVGHCLRKMVLLNLSKSYLDLAERFLHGFQGLSETSLLPSRQQIEYVLIRTLSASKLVCEAITYSQESFCFLIQKLKVGHLILDLIMATSVIARLNILLRATLEQLSSIYKQVLFWRYKIKKGDYQWAEKLNFPQDVEEWLKSSGPAHVKPLSMSKEDINRVKSMLSQINKINSKKDSSDTESVVLVNEVSEDLLNNEIIDFGEVIPRTIDKIKKISPVQQERVIQMKKVEENQNLTELQKSLLKKIIDVQSLKQLEDLWCVIKRMSQESFPMALTKKKKDAINKLFNDIKSTYSRVKFYKIYVNKPNFLEKAIQHVCKKLGFTDNHIAIYKKDPESDSAEDVQILDVPTPSPSVPGKSIKNLKLIYAQLQEMLKCKNEHKKLKSLTISYTNRITDIRRLKREGNLKLARNLTLCTSKEFLALYK